MDINENQVIYDLQLFFKVLGDETRLKIIFLLAQAPKNVGEIANALNMEQSAISHQLKNLLVNRVVSFTRVGQERRYELLDSHITDIVNMAATHMREKL